MSKPNLLLMAISASTLLPGSDLSLLTHNDHARAEPQPPSLLSLFSLGFKSDEELAAQLQQGNPDALTILFKRHSKLVFTIARRILLHDGEAEDAVQKIFFDMFRAVDQFDPARGDFKPWLLAFAYHRTYNHRRSLLAQRYFATGNLDDLDLAPSIKSQAQSAVSAPEMKLLVEQAPARLQPRQRRTIELIHFQGFTAQEVASQTGESVRVVRHNLYRGMQKLRTLLSSPQTTPPEPARRRNPHARP